MTWFTRDEVARRAGVEPEYVVRLVDLGVLTPEQPDRFSGGDVRRVLLARSLEDAADVLGIDAATLWRKRKKYGI